MRGNHQKQKIVKYQGDPPFELPPRQAQVLLDAGDIEEVTPKATPAAKADKPKQTKAAKKEAKKAKAADWPLKSTPSDYLEKYPNGPKAALAQEILGLKK